jgi:hypothetical protein
MPVTGTNDGTAVTVTVTDAVLLPSAVLTVITVVPAATGTIIIRWNDDGVAVSPGITAGYATAGLLEVQIIDRFVAFIGLIEAVSDVDVASAREMLT